MSEEVSKLEVRRGYISRMRNSTAWRDLQNILLLIFLYMMQAIPLGLASVVPLLLQSNQKTARYRDLGIFSWVSWTFSFKLLWAPIVDIFYSKRIGLRKSWLLPVQYAIGGLCFLIGGRVDRWLGRPEGDPWGPLGSTGDVQIFVLTAAFFGLNFLTATQDIVVDGWALTMLSKWNLGWAPTCQTIGQILGNLVGFTLFMIFESPDMCNTYFRSTPVPGKGFVSYSGFFCVCGAIFIVSTTLIAIFKRETVIPTPETSAEEEDENLTSKFRRFLQTFDTMLRMLLLRPVLVYIAFLFLQNIIFNLCNSVYIMKLIENGLSKETLALIRSCLLPYNILLPLIIVRWSNGPRPIKIMLNSVIPAFFLSFASIPIVYFIDSFKVETPIAVSNATATSGSNSSINTVTKVSLSSGIYVILAVFSVINTLFESFKSLSQGTFHARISDPLLGGTYMTLLNTLMNLSNALPSTVVLFFIDPLTWRTCENASLDKAITALNSTSTSRSELVKLGEDFLANKATCINFRGKEACALAGGTCRTIVDAYYLLAGVGFVCGIVGYFFLRKMARFLDSLPVQAFRAPEISETSEESGIELTQI